MFNVDTIIFINIIGGLYLIGCLFSYARCLADFGQIDIDYAMLEPSQPDKFVYFTALMSWFGFLIGSIMYLDRRFNEPFFRWNVNDIWSFHLSNKEALVYAEYGLCHCKYHKDEAMSNLINKLKPLV